MGPAITDDDLIAASRRGERDAFGRLIERHLDAVWAVSYSSTRDRALSDDVAQDTFVAAWRQLDRLREVGRVRAWLCGIARNLARKARRRAGRERPAADVAADVATDASDGAYAAMAAAETSRLVGRALDELPASYREVLVLYYQHEQSIREVASALGIGEDAAMQRLTRGRRLLATHVVDVVEGALTERRPRKALVAGVLAMLPPGSPSSLTAGSLRNLFSPAGAPMLKFAAIILATAAAGTATYVVTRPSSSAAPSSERAPATTAAAAATSAARAAAPTRALAPGAPLELEARPEAAPSGGSCEPAAHDDGECDGDRMIADDGAPVDPALVEQVGLYRGGSRGPVDAPVQIAVYQDLQCPFCAAVMGTIDQLWDEYPGQLRLVVKDFPLPGHAHARLAAEASRAADAQGKLWEFRDLALAFQEDLDRPALVDLARRAGLDVARFTADLDSHRFAAEVEADFAGGRQLAVEGTPAFFINGRRFTGARPIAEFRAAIDRALAE